MMRLKVIIIVLVATVFFPGVYFSENMEPGMAFAQVKQIDDKAGKVREESKKYSAASRLYRRRMIISEMVTRSSSTPASKW